MLNQLAGSGRFPYLPVQIEIEGPRRTLTVISDALIDSGFDGDLIIPESLIQELGTTIHQIGWVLADGSSVQGYAYSATLLIQGFSEADRIFATALGDELIVGLGVIRNYRVILDHGREVIVEP